MRIELPADDRFDYTEYLAWLERRLGKLPIQAKLAFGCCCFERLYPGYKAHADACNRQDELRHINDQLWEHVLLQHLTNSTLEQLAKDCVEVELTEDKPQWNEAIDAIDATLLIVEACQSEPDSRIARAAGCCLNRVYRDIEDWLMGRGPYVLTPQMSRVLSNRIANDPQFRAELDKEHRQLVFAASRTWQTRNDISEILAC